MYYICTDIITMTHAINSNTNLLSIDITRTHTQLRKSSKGEKECKKGMRRQRVKKRKLRKEKKGRKKRKFKKTSMNKLKINRK